jgi:hypothetical protein
MSHKLEHEHIRSWQGECDHHFEGLSLERCRLKHGNPPILAELEILIFERYRDRRDHSLAQRTNSLGFSGKDLVGALLGIEKLVNK